MAKTSLPVLTFYSSIGDFQLLQPKTRFGPRPSWGAGKAQDAAADSWGTPQFYIWGGEGGGTRPKGEKQHSALKALNYSWPGF